MRCAVTRGGRAGREPLAAVARGLAGCALLLIGIGNRGPLHLHGAQQPSFRASTEVRRVVVGVNDARGAHVPGLGVDDFVLTFGGRPGAVLEVEEVRFDDGGLASETGHSPDVFSNREGDTRRMVTLLVDDLHFQARTDAVRELARRFVREFAPGAPMGLVFTSGEGGVEPTTDRAELEQALGAFEDRFDPEGRRLKSRSIAPRLPNPRGSSAPRDLAQVLCGHDVLQDPSRCRRVIGARTGSAPHHRLDLWWGTWQPEDAGRRASRALPAELRGGRYVAPQQRRTRSRGAHGRLGRGRPPPVGRGDRRHLPARGPGGFEILRASREYCRTLHRVRPVAGRPQGGESLGHSHRLSLPYADGVGHGRDP